jgi:hypothetical protein
VFECIVNGETLFVMNVIPYFYSYVLVGTLILKIIFVGSSNEKESRSTQQADASNGFPKPPVPFTFSVSATPNTGPSFSTPTQSPFSTGFSFSTAKSSGVQSSTPLFGLTSSFSGSPVSSLYMFYG